MSNEWKMVRLGDEFLLQMGKTPDRQNVQYWNDGTNKWISIADIDSSKYLDTTKETISDIALKESGIKQIPQNTVIMSFKLSIGKVCITKDKMYSNEAIMAFIPKVHKNYDTSFLYYRLLSHNWILGLNKAVKGITLNKASLNDTEILFPKSLARQREIAAVLDKASELVEKRKAQLAELDRLAESVFYDMFGDPVTNPKSWGVSTLKNLTTKIGSGATPKGGNENYKSDGISLIRSLNVHNSKFKYKDLAFIDELQAKALDGVTVEQDDVLLNITGASVARCCIVPNDILPARVNQHVAILRVKKDKLNFKFLCNVLISSEYQNKLLKDSKSNGATREALTKSNLEDLIIIIPPLDVQYQFSTAIEKIDEQKAKVKEALKESENLFQCLMQDMFNPDYHNS